MSQQEIKLKRQRRQAPFAESDPCLRMLDKVVSPFKAGLDSNFFAQKPFWLVVLNVTSHSGFYLLHFCWWEIISMMYVFKVDYVVPNLHTVFINVNYSCRRRFI